MEKTAIPPSILTFYEKRLELSFEDKILIWNGRLVIPKVLRQSVLHVLHNGHPGITGMRAVSRCHVWWPRIDKDIEHHVQLCRTCQSVRPKDPETPLFSWSVPSVPWTRLHVDYCGPFQGKYWFLVVDATSKWLEVFPTEKITTSKTIRFLRELFARFGLPSSIVSDNGPQFTSGEYKRFLEKHGIKHITSTPYHPRTNGLAEREVRTFKNRMKASVGITNLEERLFQVLFSYRTSPQRTIGRSPAEVLFGRPLRIFLETLKPDLSKNIDYALVQQKLYHDKRTRGREFHEGEPVWAHVGGRKGAVEGVIIKRTGQLSYTVDVDGQAKRMHADHLRRRITAGAYPGGEKM